MPSEVRKQHSGLGRNTDNSLIPWSEAAHSFNNNDSNSCPLTYDDPQECFSLWKDVHSRHSGSAYYSLSSSDSLLSSAFLTKRKHNDVISEQNRKS